jgi:hypothetical protein
VCACETRKEWVCVYDDPLPSIGFNLVQICPEANLDQFCRDVSAIVLSLCVHVYLFFVNILHVDMLATCSTLYQITILVYFLLMFLLTTIQALPVGTAFSVCLIFIVIVILGLVSGHN